MVSINGSLGSLSPQKILNFEESFGIKLPNDYKAFLEKYNGGKPTPNSFDFDDGDDASCIDKFLSITDADENKSICEYMSTYEGRIPKGFLIIAHDPGGNLILLGVTKDQKGLYFWDHEMEAEDDEEPEFENMHFIATSFEKLLASLYEVEI